MRRQNSGEVPKSRRIWSESGLPEQSPLTWEGQRERAYLFAWALRSGRNPQAQRGLPLLYVGVVFVVLAIAVGFWIAG
ncbi:MAG: hypothetical protein QOG53_2187 [Frankiales bacterium]|jgi:hypothetical protein|nr:hypothetical protein [Frankiales bacterium]